jgi:ABC-type Zn uptake system ZnuABC Zn-binding protein ZnuA
MRTLKNMTWPMWLLLVLASLVGCGDATGVAPQPPTAAPASGAKPTVIATTTQLEDIVSVIAGERVTVVGLVPRNGDPHEFEPTPSDVKKVADSQAVFENGAGLETWLDELVRNAGGERPLFVTTNGLSLATIDRAFEEGGETDPHVWFDPMMMMTVVDNIARGLKRVDPQGAATFDVNAAAYKQQLKKLDAYAERTLAAVPPQHRKLVTAHDAMGYFARRYKFEIVGAVIPSVSTEAAETSAKELKELVEQIKAAGVPAIFAEASNNPKFIEQVGAEAQVRVVEDLYVDSLGEKGGEAGTYLDFFRSDVDKIAQALK